MSSLLEAQSVSQAKNRLAAAIAAKDFSRATAAVDDLIEIGTNSGLDALISTGLRGDYYGIERYIGGKIMGIPEGPLLDHICELASKSKNPKARVLLTLVLGTRTEKSAFKAVLQNLFDKDDGVVLAAVEKIQERDHTGAIGFLIEALSYQEKKDRLDGLVAYEIRRALKQLTREDMVRVVDWKNWWKPREGNFVRPPEEVDSDDQVTSVFKEPATFFDIEVPAEKVIFILDVSGSMLKKDPAPEETGEQEKRGGTGVGKGEKPPEPSEDDIPESRRRLARVQRELIETVENLPEKTQFNILAFNHQLLPLTEKLLRPTSRNRTKAINFIRGFKAEGETWTDHALMRAFETDGVRVIYLLSDGAPKRDGTRLAIDPIIDWIREANRFARVRVHTVGFEQAGKNMRKFMRRVALQNHGRYVELR